jgi:hypothetical protein
MDDLSAYDPSATLRVHRSSSVNAAARPYAAPVKAESRSVLLPNAAPPSVIVHAG